MGDFRLLSILLTWNTVHSDYVIVEKLAKKRQAFEKVRRPELPVDPELLASSIQYQGSDDELRKYGLLVPRKFLRIREIDVLPPGELSLVNQQYRNRLIYGASWRADIIAAIEAGVKNPHRISRLLGCSYEPAHRVFKDYFTARGLPLDSATSDGSSR